MRYVILLILATMIVALAVFVAGQIGFLRGKTPSDMGLSDGKLKRPSLTPNSVSSQADLWPEHPQRAYSAIAPFKTSGDGQADMDKIRAILKGMAHTVIVRDEPGYIYAQCTTPTFKFTDDIEFALDASKGIIDVRSASRLGRKDFGVNRARVEHIRHALAQH